MMPNYPNLAKAERKRKREAAAAKQAAATAAKAARVKAAVKALGTQPPLPKVCTGCSNVFYTPGRRCEKCAPAPRPVSVRTVPGGLPTLGKGHR